MMDARNFGRLGPVSALTLGGGGIGGVWGSTERAEAVATVQAAIESGITLLDVAPSYGSDHEAENVVALALRATPAPEALISTKVQLPDDEERDFGARITRSLRASLDRLGRDRLDLFLLHTQLRPSGSAVTAPGTLGWAAYRDEVVPTFERLRDQGLIRAWGLTGIGHPQAVLDALRADSRPDAVQVVVNALDLSGDMWIFGSDAEPRNAELVQVAAEVGVAVMAIRVVAAGALTDTFDRPVEPSHPATGDFVRAEPFRKLAAEFGESPAALAHRYALSVPGVATVVLGVKNRAELAECVAAEARGPLTDVQLQALRDL